MKKAPGTYSTLATGINDAGQLVGWHNDYSGYDGLINPDSLGIPSSLDFLGDALSNAASNYVAALDAPIRAFSAIYAFGDSLSDAGNDYIATGFHIPVSPPYYQGHFSNGLTWVEDLAKSLGLGPLAPSLLPGGTDFAFGGAETGATPLHTAGPTDLPSQLIQFKTIYSTPRPNALYTLSIGGEDLFNAIAAFPSAPLKALADIGAAVVNVDNFILQLAAAGGKNFLVLNVPDIGKSPEAQSKGAAVSTISSTLAAIFDAALATSLQAIAAKAKLNISVVDSYSLVDKVVADPTSFGFINVTHPVWTGNFTDPNSGTLAATNLAVQNQYLFWDQTHPTAAAHAILAGVAEMSLAHTA